MIETPEGNRQAVNPKNSPAYAVRWPLLVQINRRSVVWPCHTVRPTAYPLCVVLKAAFGAVLSELEGLCGRKKTRRHSQRCRQKADWAEERCGKPQRRAGYRPLDRVSVWQVVKQRIVDPEVKRPEPYGRLRGRMARRRKCRHTATKGAAENAAATFLRLR